MILLLLSVWTSWLILRLQPVKTPEHYHRAKIWLYTGIGIQTVLLLLSRLILSDMQLIPLVICALQGMECISAHADNRMPIPALFSFVCYQCDMTRLPAGPVLSYPAAETIRAQRKVTAETIGQGAARCIHGLFQLVALSMPMYAMQAQMKTGTVLQTAADAVIASICFYFCLYYGLKGTARIGQGIAQMLGYTLPDSFDTPLLADSLQDFRKRFLTPLYEWTERVLFSGSEEIDAAGYFARMALLLVGFGLAFGRGGSGMVWGVLAALLLTAEHHTPQKKPGAIPVQIRRILVAFAVLLSIGLLRCKTISECISFYGALLGFSGTTLSSAVSYLINENWLILLICTAGLFPLHRLRGRLPESKPLRLLLMSGKGIAELMMLLWAYSELLSSYLRE